MQIKERLESHIKTALVEQCGIKKDDRVIAAFSGGPDSLCMLNLLNTIKDELNIFIVAAHLNHSFREDKAQEDQEFCKEYCKKLNIEFYTETVDCNRLSKEWSMTPEEAGRKARYDFFAEVFREIGGNAKVAVAQNREDQVETVLYRIMRGTGLDGLAAMEYCRSDYRGYEVIRPLLDVSREYIEKYCKALGLPTRIDHTNFEPVYARNKIRLELLPLLEKEYNPNIKEAFIRLSENAKEDKTFFDKEVARIFGENIVRLEKDRVVLKIGGINDLQSSLLNRIIKLALEKIDIRENIRRNQILQAARLIRKGETGFETDFPMGAKLLISYGNAVFVRKSHKEEPSSADSMKYRIVSGDEIASEMKNLKNRRDEKGPKSLMVAFDYDMVAEIMGDGNWHRRIAFRSRNKGDIISLKVGTKKIQDYFVDAKVPKISRDKVKMVAVGREILWIPDLGHGEKICRHGRVTPATKKAIFIEITP